MAIDPKLSPSRKRTADAAGLSNNSAAKKRTTRTVQHSPHLRQQLEVDLWFACQDHEVPRQQLDRALALALDKVGFEYCDPLALESFRGIVEECMSESIGVIRVESQLT